MPLFEKINGLGLKGSQMDEYDAWGLHQIAKAVSFLNNVVNLCTGMFAWPVLLLLKLWTGRCMLLMFCQNLKGLMKLPMGQCCNMHGLLELNISLWSWQKSDWVAIRKSPGGPLILEAWSLLPDHQRLLSSMPSRRLNSSKLIEISEYFRNKLVDTIHFMEILNLKDSVEMDTFFRKLANLVEQLPCQIVLKKLLPLLASALEFGSAAATVLTALLKMGSWLSAEEFSIKVLPTIIKLYASNDRAIRVALLQHIDQYGESLSAQVSDEQTRKRVLINAFTVHVLRDIFSPARGAGVMALCATSAYYDIEVATWILPNVIVLAIDPESDFRSWHFKQLINFCML